MASAGRRLDHAGLRRLEQTGDEIGNRIRSEPGQQLQFAGTILGSFRARLDARPRAVQQGVRAFRQVRELGRRRRQQIAGSLPCADQTIRQTCQDRNAAMVRAWLLTGLEQRRKGFQLVGAMPAASIEAV